MSSGEVVMLTEKFTFDPKEGIDNPAMVITDCIDSVWIPRPRMCVLKREEGETYDFNLRVERNRHGHVIRNVVLGGIAARGGLRDGDRLLEVNNCYVDDVPHAEVARKIKLSGQQLCMLVLDGEEYEQAVTRGQDLRLLSRILDEEPCKPPRLYHITKEPGSGLGISFTALEGEKGHFSVNLVKGGAAEKAGIRKGDHLVWMNGVMVSHLTHSALSRMMNKCGNSITILVIDSESEKIYMQRKMPILPAMAVPNKLPFSAKKLRLISGPEGYGFLLRLEKTSSGNTYHVLREVDSGSPAERAGMQDGEILLEVNGESVDSLRHDEIVERVRLSGKQVFITTISQSGLGFYNQLGLSPLLFCDGETAEKKMEEMNVELSPKGNNGLSGSRLCTVEKDPLGFGFRLDSLPQRHETFISEVGSGGSGQRAGLAVGDVVLEVNGKNVEEKYLADVITLVKNGGSCISLLVMDQTSYDKQKEEERPASNLTDSEEEDDFEISFL
ncbi:NHERF family PDZ scaffold protein 4b [Xiphophorus couchianus]|uniref:NHERF family PDZ scaffold protein 4b n=1 Tax=Xiphophorus couchianus TaxID=32473 RepID=UPI001016E79C|nr:Na(+)/H(+) exchange regulatory cofactor NHE-RF3-like [Xiphophorus couchianus]